MQICLRRYIPKMEKSGGSIDQDWQAITSSKGEGPLEVEPGQIVIMDVHRVIYDPEIDAFTLICTDGENEMLKRSEIMTLKAHIGGAWKELISDKGAFECP